MSAVMASTTTTALGTITGSCRPVMVIAVFSKALVTVFCSCPIEGVGFIAALKITGEPSLIPPRIPPEWLDSLKILPPLTPKESLLMLPKASAA